LDIQLFELPLLLRSSTSHFGSSELFAVTPAALETWTLDYPIIIS
jgi:hypothetical protein